MQQIKRVLCIQDLSTIGRCSLAVVTPVISAMSLQSCPMPTALLASHPLGFEAPVHTDETSFCNDVLVSYAKQSINFHAVLVGYLSGAQQANLVKTAFADNKNSLKILDPVMADNGKLYNRSTAELCTEIKNLCSYADIITPNATESAVLLNLPASDVQMPEAAWKKRLLALYSNYPNCKAIIITGALLPNFEYSNAVLIANGSETPIIEILKYNVVPENYPGTGDLFAALLCGFLLNENSIISSVKLCASFISTVALHTYNLKLNKRYGVEFEPFLHMLSPNSKTNLL